MTLSPYLIILLIIFSIGAATTLYRIIKPEFTGTKALPIRDLTEDEVGKITELNNESDRFKGKAVKYFLITTLTFIFGWFLTSFGASSKGFLWTIVGYLGAFIVLISIVFFGSCVVVLNRAFYKDSPKSKVFEVRGPITLLKNLGVFKVGRYSFNLDQLISEDIVDGEKVVVEFSYKSKKVWKIERL